jgi:flagellar hook-length control protein FliK
MNTVSNSTSWVPAPALRVAAPSRVAGVGNAFNPPAASAGDDDAFAKALARTRDAGREAARDAARADADRQRARDAEARAQAAHTQAAPASQPTPPAPTPPPAESGAPAPAEATAAPAQPAAAASDVDAIAKKASTDATDADSGVAGKPYGVPPPDSNRSTRTAEAARRAARDGKPVDPPAGEPDPAEGPTEEAFPVDQPICYAPETEANAQMAGTAAAGQVPVAATPEANAAAASAAASDGGKPRLGGVRRSDDVGGADGTPGIVKRSALGDTRWQPASGPGKDADGGVTRPAAQATDAGPLSPATPAAAADERHPLRVGGGGGTGVGSGDSALAASALPGDRGPLAPPSKPVDSLLPAPAPQATDAPEAALQARPGTAEFAPQLGAQLAVWVRDGVHEARLQLNPADMGPVRVDIQLDGTAAQVSLSASNGETRQALEAAMPSLAGSLREMGLTLAGGGVFDQAPQSRQPSDGDSRSARGRLAGLSGLSGIEGMTGNDGWTGPLPTRRRGLVDLVA